MSKVSRFRAAWATSKRSKTQASARHYLESLLHQLGRQGTAKALRRLTNPDQKLDVQQQAIHCGSATDAGPRSNMALISSSKARWRWVLAAWRLTCMAGRAGGFIHANG